MRLTDMWLRWKSGQRTGRGGQRAFTLIELLVVISIIGILSALVVGASRRAIQAKTIKRVQAELQNLTAAINAYHNTYNQYPPDNQKNTNSSAIPNSAFTNQLFYELVGTTYITNNGSYQTPGGQEVISIGTVTNTFGVDGFLNVSATANTADKDSPQSKMFLNVQPKDHGSINGVEYLVVPAQGPQNSSVTNLASREVFNMWGYNSSTPTNNPKSFDLWAEVIIGGSTTQNPTNIISNWSADVIVK